MWLLHDDMSVLVLVNRETSEKFKVKAGVKQGYVIALTLFLLFLLVVLHIVRQKLPIGIVVKYKFDG